MKILNPIDLAVGQLFYCTEWKHFYVCLGVNRAKDGRIHVNCRKVNCKDFYTDVLSFDDSERVIV